MPDGLSRVLRTLVQLLAAGAFTALFEQLANDAPASYAPYVLIFSTLVISAAQNFYEKTTDTMLFRPATSNV